MLSGYARASTSRWTSKSSSAVYLGFATVTALTSLGVALKLAHCDLLAKYALLKLGERVRRVVMLA